MNDFEDKILLKISIEDVLKTIPERERDVIKMRCIHEIERIEVAKIYKVTKERIRQIEAKALRRLRHPTRARKLKDYYLDL